MPFWRRKNADGEDAPGSAADAPMNVPEAAINHGAEAIRAALGDLRARLTAHRAAVEYADQTGCEIGLARFADGECRFVAFSEGKPRTAFPPYEGSLEDALKHHRVERLHIHPPEVWLSQKHLHRLRRVPPQVESENSQQPEKPDSPVDR